MKKILRRTFATIAIVATPAATVIAQDFPNRPITIVVPVTAGGLSDVLARIIGEEMGKRLKTTVVIDNKTGAFGIAGVQAVLNAKRDGHTLLWAYPGPISTNPIAVKDLPYDPSKDLEPIGLAASFAMVLGIHPSVPANNLQEFIAYAKSRPGELNYASGSVGGTSHLAMEAFKQKAGVDLRHIPYRGGTPAMADLLNGTVAAMFNSPFQIMPHVREGKLRVLGLTSAKPSALAPGVLPLAASGVPGLADYDLSSWYGFFAPTGTPSAVIERLSSVLLDTMNDPAVKARIIESGAEPMPTGPKELRELIAKEQVTYRKLFEDAGIKM